MFQSGPNFFWVLELMFTWDVGTLKSRRPFINGGFMSCKISSKFFFPNQKNGKAGVKSPAKSSNPKH